MGIEEEWVLERRERVLRVERERGNREMRGGERLWALYRPFVIDYTAW